MFLKRYLISGEIMGNTSIGCDNGHYGIKLHGGLCSQTGKEKCFTIESRCRIGASSKTAFGQAKTDTMSEREFLLETDGRQFTTGSLQSEITTFAEYPHSALNRVLVHSAMHQAGYSGQSVELVAGLPFGQYYSSRYESGINVPLVEGMQDNLQKPVKMLNEGFEEIKVVGCSTMPEGMAAWFSFIMSEVLEGGKIKPKSNLERMEQATTFIDIGGQTTEVVTVIGKEIQKDYSSSLPYGSHRVLEDVRRYVLENSDTCSSISDTKLKQGIKNGSLTISGQKFDLTPVLLESRLKLVDKIRAEAGSLLSGISGDIDNLNLIGGTSIDLYEFGFKGWMGAQLLEDALFSNAKGMYIFKKYLAG